MRRISELEDITSLNILMTRVLKAIDKYNSLDEKLSSYLSPSIGAGNDQSAIERMRAEAQSLLERLKRG